MRSRWAPGATTLAAAATALTSVVFEGRSADDAMAAFESSPERSAVRAITLGTVRWYLRLAPALETLLTRPKAIANEIRALLIASAHQIEYSRNAPQLTVHAAVDAARVLRHTGATGLVNAVLRRFVAEREVLLAPGDRSLSVRTAHPGWLVEAIEAAWPEQATEILAANNNHPPMVLRVDLTRRKVSDYLDELRAAEIAAHAIPWAAAAVQLEKPVSVASLPGFEPGLVSVQDAGAQLAPALLDVQAGMRVLDACAAPGGKTGHLLESAPRMAELVAVDIDPERVRHIQENLLRLGRQATVRVGDVREPASFWDGKAFERILVDAPCSSTGVIRRHPDIKLLRRPGDIPAFGRTQRDILAAAFRMLAPGGRLVYATCSVLPAENEAVVARFLQEELTARTVTLPPAAGLAPGARDRSPGIQLLPGSQAGTDGFYYACLEKTTART